MTKLISMKKRTNNKCLNEERNNDNGINEDESFVNFLNFNNNSEENSKYETLNELFINSSPNELIYNIILKSKRL